MNFDPNKISSRPNFTRRGETYTGSDNNKNVNTSICHLDDHVFDYSA
jgi:hypothetical protein